MVVGNPAAIPAADASVRNGHPVSPNRRPPPLTAPARRVHRLAGQSEGRLEAAAAWPMSAAAVVGNPAAIPTADASVRNGHPVNPNRRPPPLTAPARRVRRSDYGRWQPASNTWNRPARSSNGWSKTARRCLTTDTCSRDAIATCSPCCVRTDPKRAAKAEAKATEILEELVRDFPDVPDYRYDLSETYARQGMVGLFRRDRTTPLPDSGSAMRSDIAEKLVAEHPNVPDYAASLARIRFWVGVRLERSEDVEGARQAMQQATETQLALVDRHPKTLSHVLQLAWMETQRARFLRDHGQLDEAPRAALDSSITSLNQNAKSSATQQRPLGFLLAGSYQMLADVLRRQDKKQLADEAAKQARQAVGAATSTRTRPPWARATRSAEPVRRGRFVKDQRTAASGTARNNVSNCPDTGFSPRLCRGIESPVHSDWPDSLGR